MVETDSDTELDYPSCINPTHLPGADPGFFVGVAEPKKWGQFGPRGPHMPPNVVFQLGRLVL